VVVTAAFLRRLKERHESIDTPTAVVVAHQDDDVIGVGSRLPRLEDVHVVYTTDGSTPTDLGDATQLGFDSRQAQARVRYREAEAALALLGIGPERVHRLGFVDQRASLDMAALTHSVLGTLRELRPEVVLTHPFENGHPDHDATSFAVHLARHLLREAGEPAPALVEFASYHDPDGSGQMAVQSFLPADTPEILVELDAAEQDLKHRLVACHASQQHVLWLFPTDRERYRIAPEYDFLAPPHPWPPLYETFSGTMTRERWQGLAAEALAALRRPAAHPDADGYQ
jgi:N-acetylglucosamine malate deacetylase 2